MALKEANGMKASRAKIGAFGNTGSGKTTTLSLLAAGLSKEFHGGAPVAFYSTEPGVDFVKPIFAAEGITLFEDRSKSFTDLLQAVMEAQRLQCCALVVDSVTHVWRELVDAYCVRMKIDKPEFHHWKDIKASWQQWTDLYVNAPIHILVAGRAGNEYEYEINEKGKKELIKGDSKMKAEGEFGYEADLLIEMFSDADLSMQRAIRKKNQPKTHETRMNHTALVRKSRVWVLNGRQFSYEDSDQYGPGGYKKVLSDFRPYLDALNLTGTHEGIDTTRNSQGMFTPQSGSEWHRIKAQKEVLLEEIQNTIVMTLGSGQDVKTKAFKLVLVDAVFGERSWSKVESLHVERLKAAKELLMEFEKQFKQNQGVDTEEALREMVKTAKYLIEQDALSITSDDTAFLTPAGDAA